MGNREEDVLPGKKLVIKVVLGAATGLVFSLLLAMISAFAAAGGMISAGKTMTSAVVCAFVGVFLGSFLTVRNHEGKRWLLGLAVGLCVFALLFLLGLVFSPPKSGVPQIMSVTLLAGLLGGLPAPRRKRRKR